MTKKNVADLIVVSMFLIMGCFCLHPAAGRIVCGVITVSWSCAFLDYLGI